MASLDTAKTRNRMIRGHKTTKARVTHFQLHDERQLTPWDEGDHFLNVQNNHHLAALAQHPNKLESGVRNPEFWSPKHPSCRIKAFYDPKPMTSHKQECVKPSLISLELDHDSTKKGFVHLKGSRYTGKEQPIKVNLFKKIFQGVKITQNTEQQTLSKTIDLFSTTINEGFRNTTDNMNQLCPALPKRSPKYSQNKKNSLNVTKERFFPILANKNEESDDKQTEKRVSGNLCMKGGEDIKNRIKELVKEEKRAGQLREVRMPFGHTKGYDY